MNETYYTKDLTLISTLMVLGYEYTEVDKSDPRRTYFHFEKTTRLSEDVKTFYEDRMNINPREFQNKFREIKDIIYGNNSSVRGQAVSDYPDTGGKYPAPYNPDKRPRDRQGY